MQTEDSSGRLAVRLERYVPHAVWLLAILAGLIIPLKILSMGFLPQDDAIRHVAKAVSGKAWSEIMVLREGFSGDHHPGWHAILGAAHRWFNWDSDALLQFSVLSTFFLVWLALFSFRKRPEAMLAALFLASICAPSTFSRLLYGRPFLLILFFYLVLLHLWMFPRVKPGVRILLSTILIAISVWIHGSWYLFGIITAAFVIVGQWRNAFSFTGCWLVGALLGGSLTGNPIAYLGHTFSHMLNVFDANKAAQQIPNVERLLVTELRPDSGDMIFALVIGLVLIWRAARGNLRKETFVNPLFALIILGWVLGFKVSRFWVDWGFPAALIWLAMEFEKGFENGLNQKSLHAGLLAGVAAVGVYFSTIRDTGERWTAGLTYEYLEPDNPEVAGWLPDDGGIIYSSDMRVFFRTFYKNPHATWRYMLGFEPGLMPQEDFQILRHIQWNRYTPKSYEPWVKKMRPEDRMILFQGAGFSPGIAGLEWKYAATDTWIGRLPRNQGTDQK